MSTISGDPIEPVFYIDAVKDLHIADSQWRPAAGRHLAHTITRAPDDLQTHVRRIHLAKELMQPTELYGAMVDLFISLGSHGIELREQMLGVAKSSLEDESNDFLKASLLSSLLATDVIPGDAVSVLSEGFIGAAKILAPRKAQALTSHDPSKLAESYVDFGEMHSARALLEIELLQGRSNATQEQQLLEIYNVINEPALYHKIYAIVDKDKLHVPAQWQALESHFSDEYG